MLAALNAGFALKNPKFRVFVAICRQFREPWDLVDTWVLHILSCLKSVQAVAVADWAVVPEL